MCATAIMFQLFSCRHKHLEFSIPTRIQERLVQVHVRWRLQYKVIQLFDTWSLLTVIAQLQLSGFGSSCRAVQKNDKVGCISNSVALSSGGQTKCSEVGCCYDADYGDISVPACFRLVTYGNDNNSFISLSGKWGELLRTLGHSRSSVHTPEFFINQSNTIVYKCTRK